MKYILKTKEICAELGHEKLWSGDGASILRLAVIPIILGAVSHVFDLDWRPFVREIMQQQALQQLAKE